MIEKQIEELIKNRITQLKLIDTGALLASINVTLVNGSYYNQTYANNIISILQQGFY